MKDSEVKPGQIWRSDETGEEWLVTRTYEDGLEIYAVLRKTALNESRRLKFHQDARGDSLPGFTRVEG